MPKLNPAKSGVDLQQVIGPHAPTGRNVVIINSVELNILLGKRKVIEKTTHVPRRAASRVSWMALGFAVAAVVSAVLIFLPMDRTPFGKILLMEAHIARADLASLIAVLLAGIGLFLTRSKVGLLIFLAAMIVAIGLYWFHPYRLF